MKQTKTCYTFQIFNPATYHKTLEMICFEICYNLCKNTRDETVFHTLLVQLMLNCLKYSGIVCLVVRALKVQTKAKVPLDVLPSFGPIFIEHLRQRSHSRSNGSYTHICGGRSITTEVNRDQIFSSNSPTPANASAHGNASANTQWSFTPTCVSVAAYN